MELDILYDVLIKVDSNSCITAIDSSAFVSGDEWIKIDEGAEYRLAQNNYLKKPITDEYGRYNYRYINDTVEEIPDEEKPPIPVPEPEISQDEYNLDFDFRLSCLELGL